MYAAIHGSSSKNDSRTLAKSHAHDVSHGRTPHQVRGPRDSITSQTHTDHDDERQSFTSASSSHLTGENAGFPLSRGQMQQTIDAKDRALKTALARNGVLERQIKDLKDKLSGAGGNSSTVEEKLLEEQCKTLSLSEEKSALVAKIEILARQIDDAMCEMSDLRDEKQLLQAEVARLQEANARLQWKFKKKEGDFFALQKYAQVS